ncbi:MAG: efflux RND transporter periplasmic adaptor subunit [Planctomycetota bacterium]
MSYLGTIRRAVPSAITVVSLSASLVAVAALSAPGEEVADKQEPVPVTVSEASWQDSIELSRSFIGEIRAQQRVELSFELAGTVEDLAADEGEAVAAGTVIARLDTARLEADLARQNAAIDAARSDLTLSRQTLDRVRRAIAADAANPQELDEATSLVSTLEARLAEAEASARRIRVDLEKSTLRAPFDAIVARRHADLGSLAQPGRAVIVLLERAAPEARIGVPPSLIDAVDASTRVVARGASHGVRRVEVLPEIDRVTRTAEVRLTLDSALGGGLREGDTAEVVLTTVIEADGFWVPVAALTQSVRGLWALYIAAPTDDGSFVLERREVEVVQPGDGRAFVRGAIDNGELIVVDGKQRLVPGMNVRPAEGGPTS